MTGTVTKFSNDGNWQAELSAFHFDSPIYRTIGATLSVRHKELHRNFFWESFTVSWVDKPAQSLGVVATFAGILPSLSAAVASRSAHATNASSCDCRLWSVGIGVGLNASAGTGLPSLSETPFPPSGGASLEVRSVSASGQGLLPNRGTLSLGPATA